MTDKLIDLAKACEAATGPDREIDTLIGYAVDLPTEDAQLPHYTASLDAALTLVPKGHDIKITQASGPSRSDWYGTCKLRDDWGDAICHKGNTASGALALCASALRARAAFSAERETLRKE